MAQNVLIGLERPRLVVKHSLIMEIDNEIYQ